MRIYTYGSLHYARVSMRKSHYYHYQRTRYMAGYHTILFHAHAARVGLKRRAAHAMPQPR